MTDPLSGSDTYDILGGLKMDDSITEAKRIIGIDAPVPPQDSDLVQVSVGVIRGLIAKAELAGAVTSGQSLSEIARSMPSARQVIRERVARLTGE